MVPHTMGLTKMWAEGKRGFGILESGRVRIEAEERKRRDGGVSGSCYQGRRQNSC